jgi:hypothetical protein
MLQVMIYVTGSEREGIVVEFPPVDVPGMPNRVRMRPGGLLQDVTHCPSRWINYGPEDKLMPWLSVRPSTLVDAGFGVFAEEPIAKGTVVSEYGGRIRTKEQSDVLRSLKQHTHLKGVYPNWKVGDSHDSRWFNGDTPVDADIPGIRYYLEGHFLAGIMNSAYFQVI